MKWRIVGTDTERDTGVAPVCDGRVDHAEWAHKSDGGQLAVDGTDVYDCCPGPHIECWHEAAALRVRDALNFAGAEICS